MRDLIRKLEKLSSYRGTLHGPEHWIRVRQFGLELASLNHLNEWEAQCVEIFSLVHDLGRIDDGRDKDHPLLGAKIFVESACEYFPDLDGTQIKIIELAVKHHADGITSGEASNLGMFSDIEYDDEDVVTIVGCCWDADRLDLLRLWIQPKRKYMSTMNYETVLPYAMRVHKLA